MNSNIQSNNNTIHEYFQIIRDYQNMTIEYMNNMITNMHYITNNIRQQQRIMQNINNIIQEQYFPNSNVRPTRRGNTVFRSNNNISNSLSSSQRIIPRTRLDNRIYRGTFFPSRSRSRIDHNLNTNDLTRFHSLDLTPVIISPSHEQINNAIETIQYDMSNNEQPIDPIDLLPFVPNENIIRIIHCGHCFRRENLIEWFQHNVRCPLCRYDIREFVRRNIPEETTSTSNMVRRRRIRPIAFTHQNNTIDNNNNNNVDENNNNDINEGNTIIRDTNYNDTLSTYLSLISLYPDISLNYSDIDFILNNDF